jgi:NADPH:quinone reductase-like Zn-dependent oxidoreductase
MRAAVVDPRHNSLEIVELDDPVPGPGQLLVAVRAAGLNRADLAVRTGRYVVGTSRNPAAPARPTVAGAELAGEVVAVGRDVEGWAVGDHVMAQGRGYAELAVVDATLALPKPATSSWAEAGALPVALLTMHDALVTNGRWRPGESVAVLAATSGVGVIGVQLALHLGAPLVFGTSRSPAKWPALTAAVTDPDRLVLTEPDDLAARSAALTDDRGVDVVIDNVGAAALGQSLAASAVLGRIVQVGRLGGRHGELDLDELARKRVSLIGVTFRTRTTAERQAVVDAVRRDLGDALAAGVLRPVVHATYPLDEAAAAQDALARDEHVGKLVLVP